MGFSRQDAFGQVNAPQLPPTHLIPVPFRLVRVDAPRPRGRLRLRRPALAGHYGGVAQRTQACVLSSPALLPETGACPAPPAPPFRHVRPARRPDMDARAVRPTQ